MRQSAEVREKCLLRLKYGFFLQKCMDSLQEAVKNNCFFFFTIYFIIIVIILGVKGP